MPSDRPNSEDIGLARVLAERLDDPPSPRTCLRWRRTGVLTPPGYDEDDQPVCSEAAIERAVTYALLLNDRKYGHDGAVIVLWGNEVGPGIPKATVLDAFRSVWEWQLKRAETMQVVLDPEVPKTKRLRREREQFAQLRQLGPIGEAAAGALTEHVRSQLADDKEIVAGMKRLGKDAGERLSTPRLAEARADLSYRAESAIVEGDGLVAMSAELADAFGFEDGSSIMEEMGGVRSINDELKTIDACKEDDALFDHLIEERDALRTEMAQRGPELAPHLGVFGPWIFAGSDPAFTGECLARMALYGVAQRIEELHKERGAELHTGRGQAGS